MGIPQHRVYKLSGKKKRRYSNAGEASDMRPVSKVGPKVLFTYPESIYISKGRQATNSLINSASGTANPQRPSVQP